jgi:hypothetical protein
VRRKLREREETEEEESDGELLRERIGTLRTILHNSRQHWKHEEA